LSQQAQTALLQFTKPFSTLLGKYLPYSFYALVWGDSGSGKTTFALSWLKDLSRFGSVGFINSETSLSQESPIFRLVQQTQTLEIPLIAASSPDVLKSIMARDMFQFVVIDSISRLGLSPNDLLQLRNTHPNRTIIGLMEANKDGASFKGANDWKHHANLMIKAEKVSNEAGVRYGSKYTVEKSQYGADGTSITIKF
jgi:hypothetical protein